MPISIKDHVRALDLNGCALAHTDILSKDVCSRGSDHRLTGDLNWRSRRDRCNDQGGKRNKTYRKKEVALPRSVAMYLCKKWTRQSLRSIGLDFGGRDYSTVIHSFKKIETDLTTDRDLAEKIAKIEKVLEQIV